MTDFRDNKVWCDEYHGTSCTVSDGDAGADAKRPQSFKPPLATRLMWKASKAKRVQNNAKWGKAMDHLCFK
ncbi:hypothetical protein FOWG_17619 [Fusarium oxysporum f. sp. lycopersici MN25]|nr:hypothetical protein FOWG_17619 [Fusarium oxysporum f. sp. lycopersici MN25]